MINYITEFYLNNSKCIYIHTLQIKGEQVYRPTTSLKMETPKSTKHSVDNLTPIRSHDTDTAQDSPSPSTKDVEVDVSQHEHTFSPKVITYP